MSVVSVCDTSIIGEDAVDPLDRAGQMPVVLHRFFFGVRLHQPVAALSDLALPNLQQRSRPVIERGTGILPRDPRDHLRIQIEQMP